MNGLRLNKPILFSTIVTGLLFVLSFIVFLLFPKEKEIIDNRNIDIGFVDGPYIKENPSVKIVVNGREVFRIDSISKSEHQENKISLENGKYLIEISTIDDRYKIKDTIEVKNYPLTYHLWIEYYYYPPLEIYKNFLIRFRYQRRIRNRNLTEEKKKEILLNITDSINNANENELYYKPTERHFSFTFKDITNYPIE